MWNVTCLQLGPALHVDLKMEVVHSQEEEEDVNCVTI